MSDDKKQEAVERVEQILMGKFDGDWSGGLRRFSDLSVDDLFSVLDSEPSLVDWQQWNNFIGLPRLLVEVGRLMEQGLDVHFIGYLVGNGREDARFTIEGICASSLIGDSKVLTHAALRGANLGADEYELRGDQVIWWWD
jgi:hypothetical protein